MERKCKVCGRPAKKNDRCEACQSYYRRKGVERPPHLYQRMTKAELRALPHWCMNCGKTEVSRYGLCTACYVYEKRNGRKRPRYLWDESAACHTCKRPLPEIGIRRRPKGYCLDCYKYKQRTGKPRPRHLWGIGPLGWCDCGQPAVVEIEGMALCKRCADLENSEY